MANSTVLKKIFIGTAGAVFITGFAVEQKAVAVGVNILNSGFESPAAPYQPADTQYYSINNITNWQIAGSAGVFNPSASAATSGSFSQPVPEGSQVAYNGGGSITQQLSTNLAANTTYNLSAYVGRRNDIAFSGYNVQLLAGNTVLASNNSVTPAAGTFTPVNVTYTSGSNDAALGQPLTISLIGNSGGQAEFDNVSLDASTPVPFEFSPGLGILALGALGAVTQLKSQVQKWKLKSVVSSQ
jgi:hypothetical protein